MSLIIIHDCDCGANHQASDLDELDEICPAYISREATTTDLTENLKMRGAVERESEPLSSWLFNNREAVAVKKPGRYLVYRCDEEEK